MHALVNWCQSSRRAQSHNILLADQRGIGKLQHSPIDQQDSTARAHRDTTCTSVACNSTDFCVHCSIGDGAAATLAVMSTMLSLGICWTYLVIVLLTLPPLLSSANTVHWQVWRRWRRTRKHEAAPCARLPASLARTYTCTQPIMADEMHSQNHHVACQ